MQKLRQVLREREFYFLTPEDTARQAARYMSERKVGAVCVLEGSRLVGILSERDLMTRVLAIGKDPEATKVSEVMTRKPVVVEATDNCDNCLKTMKQAGVRHLPVIEEGKLLGLVSLRDLLQVDLEEKANELKMMEDYIHYVPPVKPSP